MAARRIVVALLACILAATPAWLLAGPGGRPVRCARGGGLRRHCALRRARPVCRNPLEDESDFDRYITLRGVLDGSSSEAEVNQLVRRILGYDGLTPLVDDERALAWHTEFPNGPDAFDDASGTMPWMDDDIPDDPEQLQAMRVLFDAMYGEQATAIARETRDPVFARRSTVVTWIVLTTSYWSEVVSSPGMGFSF